MRSRFSGRIPMPVSRTRTTANLCSRSRSAVIRPGAGANLIALTIQVGSGGSSVRSRERAPIFAARCLPAHRAVVWRAPLVRARATPCRVRFETHQASHRRRERRGSIDAPARPAHDASWLRPGGHLEQLGGAADGCKRVAQLVPAVSNAQHIDASAGMGDDTNSAVRPLDELRDGRSR